MKKSELALRMLHDLRWMLSAKKLLLPINNYRDPVIVTAADESHGLSLEQLLDSITKFEPNLKVIIYNLGLNKKTLEKLEKKSVKFQFRDFPYDRFPTWMDIKVNAGNYAWKPQIVNIVASQEKIPLLWMDSGDKLFSDLKVMSLLVQAYGFYSPSSPGLIKDWTHEITLRALAVTPKIQNCSNLNAAIIGFDPRKKNVYELIQKWAEAATKLEIIAPIGSDKSNHRQDQALLSVLANQLKLAPTGYKKHFSSKRMNILIH